MTMSIDTPEQQRILRVAREYKQKGYQVVVAPSKSDLPEFLADYQPPDLIAQNQEETVVVEVKSRTALSQSHDLPALAKAIQEKPGWRFELVVTNPQQELIKDEYQPLNTQNILDQLAQTNQLIHMGYYNAALVLTWAAAEATMRLLGKREGIKINEWVPFSTVKTLFSLGILSQEDYQTLGKGVELRNVIVHGYQATTVNSKFLDSMKEVIGRLLQEIH